MAGFRDTTSLGKAIGKMRNIVQRHDNKSKKARILECIEDDPSLIDPMLTLLESGLVKQFAEKASAPRLPTCCNKVHLLPAKILVPLLKEWTGWSATDWKNIKDKSEKHDLKPLAEVLFCYATAQKRDTPITEYDQATFMDDMRLRYDACGKRLSNLSQKAYVIDEHASGAYALLTASGNTRLSAEETHYTTIWHKASDIKKEIPTGQTVDGKWEFRKNFRERETELVSDASAIIVYKLFAGTDAWNFDEKVASTRAAAAKVKATKTAEQEERKMLQAGNANLDADDEVQTPQTTRQKRGAARTSLLGGFKPSPAQKRRRLHT